MATKISQQLTLTGAFQVVHTVDSHRWLTINRILLTNLTAGAITVEVCFVPSTTPATAPGAANAVLYDYSINANTYLEFGKGQILPPNMTIQALASAGASVNLRVSGIEDV